jgi:hypothetical protein
MRSPVTDGEPSSVRVVPHDGDDTSDWQPATSEPGDLYTYEGRIRGAGAFARGLKHRDPRGAGYRRAMTRGALAVIGIGAGVAAVVAVAAALL